MERGKNVSAENPYSKWRSVEESFFFFFFEMLVSALSGLS